MQHPSRAKFQLEKTLTNLASFLAFTWLSTFVIGLVSATVDTSPIDSDLPDQNVPLVLGAQSTFQNYPHAAVFSDNKYSTLRLENFGTSTTDRDWTGPDFIVAQSSGEGLFFLQPGGNLYAAGVIASTGIRIQGDINLDGDIYDSGQKIDDRYLHQTGGAIGGNLNVAGTTAVGDLTVTGSITAEDNTLGWNTLSKENSSIEDLEDVVTSSRENKQALFWDAESENWVNQDIFDTTGQRSTADFVIYLDQDNCRAFNGNSGLVTYSSTNHSECIQYAIDRAGTGGVLAFRPGSYLIGTQLLPKSNQTWWTNKDAVFQPTGDNRIVNFEAVDLFSLHGTLMIDDPDAHSTSTEAIRIEDVAQSYFERIFIRNYYRGMSMSGTSGGTHENTFVDLYMQVRDRGLSLQTSSHDNHFMHIWIKGPAPTKFASGSGIYIATSGTQGGNVFDIMEVLDMNIGLELPGAFETWFGNVVVDNAYAEGITIGGSVERLFFDTIWTASSGDGIIIQGNTSSPADKIQIGKIYAWLNANYGIRIAGYVENLNIGLVTVQRNAKGLAVSGVENKNITIDSLTSFENTNFGVDGSGITENVYVNNALISDSVLGLDYFTGIDGSRPGTGSFKSRGIAKIISGDASIVVEHQLEGTPTNISLSPYHDEVAGAYISARDSDEFIITVSTAVSADREIGWTAQSGRQLGAELIANPNVETGTDDPDNWNKSASGAIWSTNEARSGTHAIRLNVTGSTADWRSDAVEVTANSTYRLRAFVKGIGSNQTYLTVRWFTDTAGTTFISEENILLDSSYTDWTEARSDFIAPATAQSADVMLRIASSSTADLYADEFSLRKVN